MLVTVIIFLREVLEAALILSVLLAVSFQFKLSRKWIFPALSIGFLGATISAYFLGDISNLLEGTGQEVMNSTLLITMCFLINIICIWIWQCLNNNQAAFSTLLAKNIKKYLFLMSVLPLCMKDLSYLFIVIH